MIEILAHQNHCCVHGGDIEGYRHRRWLIQPLGHGNITLKEYWLCRRETTLLKKLVEKTIVFDI